MRLASLVLALASLIQALAYHILAQDYPMGPSMTTLGTPLPGTSAVRHRVCWTSGYWVNVAMGLQLEPFTHQP